MEKDIAKDLIDSIKTFDVRKVTLNSRFDAYINDKRELKSSTRTNYKYMYKKYVSESLGKRKIADITYSDIKKFYNDLILVRGFKPNSMEIIHTILHPIFTTAVKDGLIRINPTDGAMSEIKRTHNWTKKKRHALTIPEQRAFVGFIKNNDVYYHWFPVFTVLLGTGMRAGEFTGLRWEDCDFKNNVISVNHNLVYRPDEHTGKVTFYITTPKTEAGIREIPMISDVRNALVSEYMRQKKDGFCEYAIGEYTGFVFSNRDGKPLTAHNLNRAIERIRRDYNIIEADNAVKEKREPVYLPHFSVHNLRHTFCVRFCENESNIKVIQEIMGHADASTTMDIYNEATKEFKQERMSALEGKIIVY